MIKKRAARGALLVGGRTVAIRALGLIGNLFLARLLTPTQFGLIASGVVILTLSALIGNGGFGAALVRGEEEPTTEDLETMAGFTLAVSLAAMAVVAVIAPFAGEVGWLALVMMLSVPVSAFRASPSVMLERHLTYPPLVRAEVAEVVVYQVAAVVLVVLGAGVWGVAAATVLQAVTGAALLIRSTEIGFVRPRLHRANFRRLAPFGLRVQLMAATSIGLVQGLNVVVGAFGGLSALGLWSFASRLIQPVQQVFETLRYVSYPSMARLRDAGEDLEALTADALRLVAVASSFVIVPIAGSAPALIAFAFGHVWVPSGDLVTLVLLSLIITGSVATAFQGLLLTYGHAGVALRLGILQALTWLATTAILYPLIGLTAVGVGALVVAPAQVAFYVFYARAQTGLGFALRPLAVPAASAALSVGVGRALEAELGGPVIVQFAASAAVGLALYLVLAWFTERATMLRLAGMVRRSKASA